MRARLLIYVFLALAPGLVQALGLGKLQLAAGFDHERRSQHRSHVVGAQADVVHRVPVRDG